MASSFFTIFENRIICGCVVFLLSTFGLIANLIILLTRSIPKRRLMSSLIFASFVFLLPYFIVYVPCAFTYCEYFDENWLNFLSTPDTIGYYVYQLSLVHLLVDRFLVFYFPKISKIAQRYEIQLSISIWLFILILTVTEWFFNCRKRLDPLDLHFFFDAKGIGEYFLMVHMVIAYGAPIIMAIISIAVFRKIKRLRDTFGAARTAQEYSLMMQYLFICAFSWFGCIFFFFLPQFRTLLNASLTLLPPMTSIISITSHSYIFLFTNSEGNSNNYRPLELGLWKLHI